MSDPAKLIEDAVLHLRSRELERARACFDELRKCAPRESLAAFGLHLLGILDAVLGRQEQALDSLAVAAALERAGGWKLLGQQTTHQRSLILQNGGNLEKTIAYYVGTIRHLQGMGNRQGRALCQKSLAELRIASGRLEDGLDLLRQARVAFEEIGCSAESKHLGDWLGVLEPALVPMPSSESLGGPGR